MSEKIKVLIADDHPVVRAGISSFLKAAQDLSVVGEAVDGRRAVEMARFLRPDVILMDLKMPRLNGAEATAEILTTQPDIQVVILTGSGFEELAFTAIRAGAVGYLTKTASFEQVLQAIRQVHRGELALDPEITRHLLTSRSPEALPLDSRQRPRILPLGDGPGVIGGKSHRTLTPRQVQIVRWLTKGCRSQEIATLLGVSESTIRSHLSHIFKNLGLESRLDLLRALRQVRRGEPSPLPREVVEQLRSPATSAFRPAEKTLVTNQQSLPSEPLTRRETEVLACLAKGLSNQQIADRLHIAEATVRTHVSRLLKKLGATNRVEAALYALHQEETRPP